MPARAVRVSGPASQKSGSSRTASGRASAARAQPAPADTAARPAAWSTSAAVTSSAATVTSMPESAPHTIGPVSATSPEASRAAAPRHPSTSARAARRATRSPSVAPIPSTLAQHRMSAERSRRRRRARASRAARWSPPPARRGCRKSRVPRPGCGRTASGSTSRRGGRPPTPRLPASCRVRYRKRPIARASATAGTATASVRPLTGWRARRCSRRTRRARG